MTMREQATNQLALIAARIAFKEGLKNNNIKINNVKSDDISAAAKELYDSDSGYFDKAAEEFYDKFAAYGISNIHKGTATHE